MLPVIPLRDTVVFPDTIMTLFVGRNTSVAALEHAIEENMPILLVAQKEPKVNEPDVNDLYDVGTVANITQLISLPDNTLKVLIDGTHRVKINQMVMVDGFIQAKTDNFEDEVEKTEEIMVIQQALTREFKEYAKLNRRITPEMVETIAESEGHENYSYLVASQLVLSVPDRQELLATSSQMKRLEKILVFLKREADVLNTEERIRQRIKHQMEKSQREYYLQEQLKAIQKELKGEDAEDEMDILERKITEAKLPSEAHEKAMAELKKLRMMNPMAVEASVIRNYIDWILDLPWKKPSALDISLEKAKEILDRDHYGLDKVKERILEFLAVQKRVGHLKGQILCFVGAPGMGKTSLGRSIAEATARKYVRVSLGGLRDESEIRGHRRTYIGSMPGRIIQSMKKAKMMNPLFLLDEIDKMGSDWRGDPGSAMLEVLDPEQNSTFNDHYLEIDYDLSHVMFVATANSLNLSTPLLDRMEIIHLDGYTEQEKVEIAKRHLLPKQREANGLKAEEWSVSDDAIRNLIRYYTRESGVRNLEREIASLARKAVAEILNKNVKSVEVTPENLEHYIGVHHYKFGIADLEPQIGTTTGLAWTQVGGDLLSIEAVKLPGKGRIVWTGKLGEVMQESIQAAFSYTRTKLEDWHIDPQSAMDHDVHVHVPEGATPKDGPSAGIAICTSVVSVLSGRPVRADVAMTGEITLRGHVLPIGGLKEKLLAAVRGQIKTVLIPQDNMKDLVDLPAEVTSALKIIPVKRMNEVLFHALLDGPSKVLEGKKANKPKGRKPVFPEDINKIVAH